MALKQRVIVEIYDDQSKEVFDKKTIEDKVIKSPKQIEDVGYNHKEQIDLLQSIQDSFLSAQSKVYELPSTCPSCTSKTHSSGYYASTFNSVFTDHKIKIARRICSNQDCGKLIKTTIQGLFGEYRHPDLLSMQSETAASHSFVETQNIMDAKVKKHRPVNGQLNIKRVVERVGAALHEVHQDENTLDQFDITPAKELIVQTDGGHIKDKHPNRSTFEALLSKVYSSSNIRHSTSNTGNIRGKIISKSYAASSYKDHHKSIKQMTLIAAKKEGLTRDTDIVALSDGAKNCWSVLKSLEKHCHSIVYILDWWHIKKRFDTLIGQMDSQHSEELESIKWKIWHGNKVEAIERLTQLYTALITTVFADKAHDLLKYIINSQEYLINYEERKSKGQVFTSSAIESGIESVVNARLKKKQKAQWTREVAHKVLQIRTSILSNQWEQDWKLAKATLYKLAA